MAPPEVTATPEATPATTVTPATATATPGTTPASTHAGTEAHTEAHTAGHTAGNTEAHLTEASPRTDGLARLSWFARSSIAPPLAIALACLFIVVNEVGHRTVRAITLDLDEAVHARISVGRLRATVFAAESAQRGLMLTARPVYRESFATSLKNVDAAVTEMRRVATNRPQDAQAVRELVDLAQRKVSELQEIIKQLDNGNRDSAMALLLSDIGREQMADIDRNVEAMVVAQNQEMRNASALRDQVLFYSRLSILGLVLSCLAAVLTTLRVLRHRNADRLSYVRALRAERDNLEATVARRTDDISDLARHLQTVREDERSHLARELHDELGGLLTAAKLDLARMRSRLTQAGPEVAERVAHLHRTLDAGIALKRRIIEDLRPSSLDNLGLAPALRILCQEWSAASEVPVHQQLEELVLPPDRALVVYRLVQEALTNVAKYAQATEVRVTLATHGAQAMVQVGDNGRGFVAQQRTLGHGLAGMRFRVASIGGVLTVTSAPGKGTTIQARLPLLDSGLSG